MRGILIKLILRYIFKYKVTKKIKTKNKTRKAVTLMIRNLHFNHDDYFVISKSMPTVDHQGRH